MWQLRSGLLTRKSGAFVWRDEWILTPSSPLPVLNRRLVGGRKRLMIMSGCHLRHFSFRASTISSGPPSWTYNHHLYARPFFLSSATNPPPSLPVHPPTSEEIDAVIQQATSAVSSDGRHVPLKDTRTQLFVGNVRFLLSSPLLSPLLLLFLPLPKYSRLHALRTCVHQPLVLLAVHHSQSAQAAVGPFHVSTSTFHIHHPIGSSAGLISVTASVPGSVAGPQRPLS
jgi:hypothetical protein